MADLNENEQKVLLLKIAAGSEHAFAQLFHSYRDKLYSFILTISGSRQLAEDTVQEVFLKIWERHSEAGNIHQFDSYLFTMARNHVLNAFKRMSKETMILKELSCSADSHEIINALESREMESKIKEAIKKLPGKQKQVFMLSRDGLKQADISRLLNITVPTVKSHITQAVISISKECRSIYSVLKIFMVILSSFLP